MTSSRPYRRPLVAAVAGGSPVSAKKAALDGRMDGDVLERSN